MIFGIGCDIVEISRIKLMLDTHGDLFKRKVFTKMEISMEKGDLACYYANRFAAKEAYAKAVGVGISDLLSFKDIEILYDVRMKPYFSNASKAHLSMSNDGGFAIAYVVIEG
ncbi:Holo-[acyl-carrier-protein] synthase [Candidatus Cyrtobacter comes]|uniref:Holo-[acyl-carrier-protein] synthase n=1 Tax=Candidatus Cyrtobacter comes TaxID=675776 RepID=A0ABU5L922_9RICK|nr:holo-ACP synthase [Candidatus Cyrtobacter comes]MDZ5762370.1 Holo-[acyl-carrier-protein] synthase [Candidatus Cyrtobacter comes]